MIQQSSASTIYKMGWFWNSNDSKAVAVPTQAAPVTEEISTAPATSPSPTESKSQEEATTYKRALTRDEIAEKELNDLLAEINQESSAQAAAREERKFKRKPNLPTTNAVGATQDTNLSLEDSLYPTQMSCREAFDSAFYCQSLGGQFNALYRYGGIQSCSEHWSAFWFCMRSRSYPEDQKAAMIRDHYKKRALKYKVGPSSEDVWESREKRIDNPEEAFSHGIQELLPGETDQQWNERERKRRESKAAGTI
jgi:hypothetical protein